MSSSQSATPSQARRDETQGLPATVSEGVRWAGRGHSRGTVTPVLRLLRYQPRPLDAGRRGVDVARSRHSRHFSKRFLSRALTPAAPRAYGSSTLHNEPAILRVAGLG